MKKIFLSCFLGLGLALATRAQGVFQASLATPAAGGSAQLELGNIWFQVVGGEVNFAAYVSIPGIWASSLNPVLSVPGRSSVDFTLGEAQPGWFRSAQQQAAFNPFLLSPPMVPAGYDDDGIPYYVISPGFMAGDYYTGHFALPPGFLDELLAGNGKVELNSSIGGNITVAAAPEPSAITLAIMAGGCLLLMWRRKPSPRHQCR